MDVSRYLDRIGHTGDRTPNAANLTALVRAHRLRVPYETLDLWRGVRTSLDLDALYDKIVTPLQADGSFSATLTVHAADGKERKSPIKDESALEAALSDFA